VHFQTGTPLNDLLAHPVYLNAGEIPSGGRGSLGRIGNFGTVDMHADYPIRITERTKIRLAADLFNLTNQRHLLAVDQNEQVTVGVQNIDFQKPGDPNLPESSTYQRPFYARFGVKFEF
jgi:outer membrane receptor protein involved in Fe transport